MRLKKEERANLRKEKKKSYKVTLNISIMGNKNITQGIAIRN